MDILDYAHLANLAYTVAPTIGDETSSSRAVVATNADGVVVGFPGTNNGRCLETDIDAITHDAGAIGRVHRGTFLALESIWAQLVGLSPSVVYGHSLGGMLALMFAARLCEIGKPPKAVYAFEPAKISVDRKIRDLLTANGVKVTITQKGNDAIPMLPEVPLETWQHPAKLLRIGTPRWPIPNIEDHMMDEVIVGITEYIAAYLNGLKGN
jgi:pimeloyl-ACP methyl ester carboxylesterase